MIQIFRTADGSDTLYVPELNEHYHSVYGAVQESLFIFINNGFHFCQASPLSILEIGFGTGLNALLTAIESKKGDRVVNYSTIENNPLDDSLIRIINHGKYAGENGSEIFQLIHSSRWNENINICKNFNINKINADLTKEKLAGSYDLIYFDAFGPDKQPEMWTPEIFATIASVTAKNGIIVTYSAKGQVRRNLIACGFEVSLIPGPPGKRQMIRAMKI